MRTLLKRLIPLLVLSVGTSAFAQFRIATVDLSRVFTNYWKTREAQTAIQEHQSDLEKTGKEKLANLNKAKEEYQKMLDSVNDQAISSEERDKRQKDAETKLRDLREMDSDLQDFDRGAQAALQEQFKRTHDNIVSDIRVVVNARAKTDGYTMVLDTSSQAPSGVPTVLYCVPGDNDLTDAIIKQINAGAPVETRKPDDKPAAKDSTH